MRINRNAPIDILAKEGWHLYDKTYTTGDSSTFRRQLTWWKSIIEWKKDGTNQKLVVGHIASFRIFKMDWAKPRELHYKLK